MTRPLRILGIGALVGGGVAVLITVFIAAILIGPLVFWLAWNVLDFGPHIGLPELGFWSIVLATLFLIVGGFGKALITAIVFIIDPGWLDGAAQIHWPEPNFTNFVAILLLSILASRPHAHAHKGTSEKKTTRKAPDGGPWKAIASEVRTAIETERDGTKAPRV